MRLAIPILMAVSMLSAVPAQAGPCPGDRPCVGLVLAGGGARGAAHVGVLEVMEELRVPVDFIVGTSMGAIVGGMYASGLSPAQMRERLVEIDWAEAFNDDPPRRNIPFRQKLDDDLPLFKLELGFGKGSVGSPSGLVAGQKLSFILGSLLLHQAGTTDFDELPIPFRAVAVDLVSGDVVVLGSGNLVNAIRASMAFPVAFTPVPWGEQLLVDGGVLRNMPVDVAQQLGADRVIAIDVGSPFGEMKETPSALKLMRRTISVMTREVRSEELQRLREQDLRIVPDLEGIKTFESFDPDTLLETVERGVEAARGHEEQLREFAVAEETFERFLARQRGGGKQAPLVIDRVEVRGVQRVSPGRIKGRVETRPGSTLDIELLEDDLRRVYQIGEFEQVGFSVDREDGENALLIEAREKSWGPWFYRLGAQLQANLEGKGQFIGNVLLRRPNLNRLGGEWKSFLTVGDLDSVFTELYQPLGYRGTFFVAPRLTWGENGNLSLFEDDEEFLVRVRQGEGGLDLGLRLGNLGELRLGATRGFAEFTPRSGPFSPLDDETGGWRVRLQLDGLDNANFPRQGTFFRAELYLSRAALGADREYDRLFVTGGHAFRAGAWTHAVGASFGSALGSDLPIYDALTLGGFLRLSGLQQRQLLGDREASIAIIPYRRIGEFGTFFGGDAYVGASLEAGNAWNPGEPISTDSVRVGGALWAGMDTLFGPVYLGHGWTDGGATQWHLFIGRTFGARGPASGSRLGR